MVSMTSYIGSNVELPVREYEEESREKTLYIGPSFSDEGSLEEIKETKFSTKYVYEVTFDWWGIELSQYQDEEMYAENKQAFHLLCDQMDAYLSPGEYFYLYTCWIGDESNPIEGEISLPLKDWYREGMELTEQTLIRFVKNES